MRSFTLLLMPLIAMTGLPVTAAAEAELQGSAVLALKSDRAAISPEQAKTLSPRELGRALLSEATLPVVEATVGPQGMEPPAPPGPPAATRVKLYLQPTPATEPGFCQQLVATLFLKPAKPMPDATSPSWTPRDISTVVSYRWIGEGAPATLTCSAPRTSFFTPEPGEAKQALQAVRLLVSANAAAKHGRRLAFPLSVEDLLGPEMLDFQRKHPELRPVPGMKIIKDAREALAVLPINAITFVGPASRAYPDILQASDLTTLDKHSLRPMTLFLGGEWTVGLVLDQEGITRMRLRRAIPAPF